MGKLLCIGATGSIGRHVVAQALAEGHEVRAVTRRARHGLPAGVEVMQADITAPGTLGPLVEGVDRIVFTHGNFGAPEAVDYGAVRNVLMALGGRPVRIALMTTIAVTDRKGNHDWKRRAERLVRASGNAYTIVRPGWFDYNARDEEQLVMLQGDRRQSGSPRDGAIARPQLARVLLGALRCDSAAFTTLELVSARGTAQPDLAPVFGALEADTDGLDGVHDLPNMPLAAEPADIREALAQLRGMAVG